MIKIYMIKIKKFYRNFTFTKNIFLLIWKFSLIWLFFKENSHLQKSQFKFVYPAQNISAIFIIIS
jgi:hypothetical protein